MGDTSIAWTEKSVRCDGEGCLSIPYFRTSKMRHQWVVVSFRDLKWQHQQLKLENFAAQVAQHEEDHLNGRLITDDVSRQQRRQAEREVAKYLEKLSGPR